jgi:hypothetical protein
LRTHPPGEPAGRALLLVQPVVVGLHVPADDVLQRQVQDHGATSVAHKETDLIGRGGLAGVTASSKVTSQGRCSRLT